MINSDYKKIKRVLITNDEIQRRISEVAAAITEEYRGKPLLLVGILSGVFVFMADFCRKIQTPSEVAFMYVKSYCGTKSTAMVDIVMDLNRDISNYHVVLVEDIVDTGRTLHEVDAILRSRNPLSLKVVTLLDKPSKRVNDFQPDISLFKIPDLFVIGYGLDFNEKYRELPYIAEYDESI